MVSSLNRRIRLIVIFIFILGVGGLCLGNRQALLATVNSIESSKYVRVAIIQDTKSLDLKVTGSYEITDARAKKVLSKGKNLKTTLTSYKEGILLGGMNFNMDKIFIQSVDHALIIINGRRFRGNMEFVKKDNLGLVVINYIELEDYIKGILYHEVSHYWPIEALKAQAVVCRTYALNQMQENKSKDYDVTADIYSQVYGGRTSERYRTNEAVESTRGEVLTFEGDIFPAYYHATCAGHTEDASLLWNIDIPPLKGVACNYCKNSPHFKWHTVLSTQEVGDALAKSEYKIKAIKDILIDGKDRSGRIINLKLVSDEKNIKVPAKDFRNIIGPNILRSTNFKVKVIENDVVFEGLGWGHGVGLCQWGAYFMAKEGDTFRQILEYYYPGSKVSF